MLAGFRHLKGYFKHTDQCRLLDEVREIVRLAPLYRPVMPRTARPFSVLMTNAGDLGWVSDATGYRYQPAHPETLRGWPPIPSMLIDLWSDATGWPGKPEACLINYYKSGAKMGSHVDRDEEELSAPVLSVSLGDAAVFHVGGLRRTDAKTRMTLESGDVAVLGGESRRAYHGIDRIMAGTSSLLPEGGRFNLTLRRVTAYQA